MEKIFEQTLLYDFYGELLNEHQKNIFEDAIFNDLSLSEIATNYDISRQAAHDLLKRVNKLLSSYEEKLHLVERFSSSNMILEEVEKEIDEILLSYKDENLKKSLSKINDKIRKIRGD